MYFRIFFQVWFSVRTANKRDGLIDGVLFPQGIAQGRRYVIIPPGRGHVQSDNFRFFKALFGKKTICLVSDSLCKSLVIHQTDRSLRQIFPPFSAEIEPYNKKQGAGRSDRSSHAYPCDTQSGRQWRSKYYAGIRSNRADIMLLISENVVCPEAI